MKRTLLRVALLVTAIAAVAWGVVSCSSREEFRPQLEVLSADGVPMDGRSVNYGAEGGSTEFVVRSNGEWSVESGAPWLELSPLMGTGDGKVGMAVGAADGSRSAVVEVSLAAAPQVRVSFDVVQRVAPPQPQTDVIYRDGFDGAAARADYGENGDAWPSVAEFPEFADFCGRGSEEVGYTAEGVSVRGDGPSSEGGYDGASGGNNLFFDEYSALEVSGVALEPSDGNMRLTFGRYVVAGDSGCGPYPAVWVSGDGKRWSRLRYDADPAAEGWHEAACDFSLVETPASLRLMFVGAAGTTFRIDDVMLCEGEGGSEVDLDAGGDVEREYPPAERAVSVSEIVAMMPVADGHAMADATADLVFDAVVQTDFGGGNCEASTLALAEAGAIEAGCGLLLRGSGVDTATGALAVGACVRVRLLRSAAMLCNDGGALYVTGGAEQWFEIEPTGTVTDVPVAAIEAGRMAEYQNMTVAVAGVESARSGVWCDSDDGEHIFQSAGGAVRVFVRGGAAAFAGRRFGAAAGELRGIVTVRDGEAWLCPRNAGDVAPFEVVAPLPAEPITIPEIIGMMPGDGMATVIDAERDRVLTAVVMNDVENGNCNPSHLILATEGSSEERNGITLYGSRVTPAALGVKRGDRVAVTLKASKAVALIYGGMYEVTGDESAVWAEVEVLDSELEPAVTEIGASQLADYQGMAVRIRDAVPERGGVWWDAESGGDIRFSTDGGEFDVRVLPDASFADDLFAAVVGDIAGLAVVADGRAVLMPRDGGDVASYADSGTPAGPDDPVPPSVEDPAEPDEPATPPAEDPAGPDDPTPEPPVGDEYVEVNALSELGAGAYHIGGYRNGHLYLACGGLTAVNHCNTAEFRFEGGSLVPVTAAAAVVTLEPAGVDNGYYIRFENDGYLSASGSGAGKLRFTQSRAEYWIFSENPSGGFDLVLSGDWFVRLVMSKTAPDALLRSMAADEQGGAVTLIRRNGVGYGK